MYYTIQQAPKQTYAEIGQDSKVIFSLGVKEGKSIKELFSPVKCRDFFNEICLKQWTGKDYSIYRFTTKNCPVFDSKTRPYLICYKFPEERLKQLIGHLAILDKRIVVMSCKEAVVIKLPLYYIKYTFLMSYITFLIRCVERFGDALVVYGNWTGNEGQYINSIQFTTKKNVLELFDAVCWIVKNYKELPKHSCNGSSNDVTVGTLHSSSGIVGTLSDPVNEFRQLCEQYWKETA